MQRLSASVLSIALLLCVPLAASAQVYTWTDAQGTVHYTDTPPRHGTHYKGLRMPGATATPAPRATGDNPAQGRGHADSANAATTGSGSDSPASDRSLCDNLTANMQLLAKDGPVVMHGENGKNQLLSKNDRATELAREKQQYQTYCTQ